MKALFVVAAFALALSNSRGAEFKFATVDLQRVLAEYHKAKDATKLIQQKEVSFVKELETLRLEGRKIIDEAGELRRLSLEPVLSIVEREKKQQDFQQKLADLRDFDVRYERARSDRSAELQTFAERLNKRVIEDVLIATRVIGEEEGFNFILNASRLHPASSEVLFSSKVTDVTTSVLAKLNATRPGLQPAARP